MRLLLLVLLLVNGFAVQAHAAAYWLMATRENCSSNNANNICGNMFRLGTCADPLLKNVITLPCVVSGGLSFSQTYGCYDGPVYYPASSRFITIGYLDWSFSLPALTTGFYVFAYDEINDKWVYQSAIGITGLNFIIASSCDIQPPSGCQHEFRFSCEAPTDQQQDKPLGEGGGACQGKNPNEDCKFSGGVIWDNKEKCEYHCADCEGQYSDWVNTCAPGTLAQYGDQLGCNYYCDCSKASADRERTCPMGATVDPQTCNYTCTPCYMLEYQCQQTCQAQTGMDPVINTCQESLMGNPYERTCTCPAGNGHQEPGDVPGDEDGDGQPDNPPSAEECPECPILQAIKEDTASLVLQGNDQYDLLVSQVKASQDTLNLLGEMHEAASDHYFNSEELLSDILDAIINKPVGGGASVNVDVNMQPVVDAVNGLRPYLDTISDDINALKQDLHTALYDGDTPYQAEMLAELRRLTKGFLETANGAEPNSFISKFQALTYMENGEWVLRTSSQGSSGWESLLALLTSFFAGSLPDTPEFDDFDLTALSAHADPEYQAGQALQGVDVEAAAAASAARYGSLRHPVISVLDPQPCIYGASGLSICFNTDQWQMVYASLKYFGYFLAHLSVWVLVYQARTGLSSVPSSE